ncbi:hypothetical protein Rhopal_006951-T1 [Rhodotorula paludigena]|uniref:Signal recognition particle, SRP9/SRP14 subunit n=1 Tax=Rhodotorula paludigena TaxID=86838 RepID=A0AAV5GXX2_9BASI|nr:hypothetical protein Rhopal_006951-T1 [Rhodotorula paludigena]
MLFRDWDRFAQACDVLCQRSTRQTGLLVLRVTDDQTCLTFKARSSVYLNRFDALNRALLRQYQNKRRVAQLAVEAGSRPEVQHVSATVGAEDATAETAPGGAAGTSKAKKRKGKKKTK